MSLTDPLEPRTTCPARECDAGALLLAFVTAAEAGLVLTDLQGRVRWCNPAVERLTGYSADELHGRRFPVARLEPAPDDDERDAELQDADRSSPAVHAGWRVRKDGERYRASVSTTALRDPSGAPIGYALVARDLAGERGAAPELHRQEERYRAMVDAVRDYAIFMLDPHGVIQTWNPGAERTKGYAAHEIIGQSVERFYTPEDLRAGRPARLLREAADRGRVEDEGWRVRKDGTRFWADVVITAIRDASGSLRGYVKVTRDLSERRRAEEALRLSEERFRLLVEGVEDYAIFMLDPQGRVATWNAGAERIKGYRPKEIVGQHFSRFFSAEDLAAGKPQRELETAAREGRAEDEGWRVRKDGTRFWASVVLTALHNEAGALVGFAKVTRDLTARVRAEQERIQLGRAEEAVRLRDDFLSIASHELRTPLTSLQLQLDSVAEARPGDPKTLTRLDRARRSLRRLVALVDALLDVSRISSGKLTLQLEQVELREVIAEVVERLGYAAEASGCTVILEPGEAVAGRWDRLRVDQVISNLLSNAFRYAPGAPVEISAGRDGSVAILCVRDRGPGVPAEARRRVFERFERAASQRHYGGLGLGLYVAREIVEQHGGTIAVDDAPGGGARFCVRLPLEGPGANP